MHSQLKMRSSKNDTEGGSFLSSEVTVIFHKRELERKLSTFSKVCLFKRKLFNVLFFLALEKLLALVTIEIAERNFSFPKKATKIKPLSQDLEFSHIEN